MHIHALKNMLEGNNQDVGKNLKGLICLNVYPKVSGDVKETLNSNDACFGPEFILVFL